MLGFEKKGGESTLKVARMRDELRLDLNAAVAANDKDAASSIRARMMMINGGVVEGPKGKSSLRTLLEELFRPSD